MDYTIYDHYKIREYMVHMETQLTSWIVEKDNAQCYLLAKKLWRTLNYKNLLMSHDIHGLLWGGARAMFHLDFEGHHKA